MSFHRTSFIFVFGTAHHIYKSLLTSVDGTNRYYHHHILGAADIVEGLVTKGFENEKVIDTTNCRVSCYQRF